FLAAGRSRGGSLGWCSRAARADTRAGRGRWLCLVVVQRRGGVALISGVVPPLAVQTITAPASPAAELPDLRECWAWAHSQAAAAADAAQVGQALNGASELSLARLVCPRVLAPNTDYIACVVPTFELGRKAALG